MASNGYYDSDGVWHEPGEDSYRGGTGNPQDPYAPPGYTSAPPPSPPTEETAPPPPTTTTIPPPAPPPVPPGGTGGGGGYAIDPSYLAPWMGVFDPGERARIPDYVAPAPFSYADWQAPDPRTILNDPSYLWRRDQGSGVLENAAAAKGVLNTGGTLKDLIDYGQNFASNEYGNIFNRDLSRYTTNRNNAADVYATNYGLGRDTYQTKVNNANTEWQRAWNDYRDRENVWFMNQNAPFSKLSSLIGVGANAAGAA